MEYIENYQNRLTIFIDILGFKSILNTTVKEHQDQTENIKKIQDIYSIINSVLVEESKKHKYIKDLKFTIFSDCIVISMLHSQVEELFFLLMSIKHMIMCLIDKSILCRGAITYGKLIHTDHFVFGPALVHAYTLESKSANYPRIIIDYTIMYGVLHETEKNTDDISNFSLIKYIFFKKDLDGMFYIDYFNIVDELLNIEGEFYDKDDMISCVKYLYHLKSIIYEGLKANNPIVNDRTAPDIRVKYLWMRTKINKALRRIEKMNVIDEDIWCEYSLHYKIKKWV